MEDTTRQTLGEIFRKAKNILVIYSENSDFDKLAFTTTLYELIKKYKPIDNDDVYKTVSLLSTKNLASEFSKIDLLNETKLEIGNKNLCVSFEYIPDSVEKVSYYIDEDSKKFYLTIQPKEGIKPLDKENIEYFYTGADAEMIFLVGIDSLDDLKHLYMGYENLYQSAALVSVNNYETDFAHFNFDVSNSSCYSEYLISLAIDINLMVENDETISISSESATHLLSAITEQTNNFESYMATASTFEVVAKLLRMGARRTMPKKKELFSSTDFKLSGGDVSDFASVLAQKNKKDSSDLNIVEQNNDYSEQIYDIGVLDKGDKPKKRSANKKILSSNNNSTKAKSKTKKQSEKKSEVGSLNYNPSGFGPKAG